MDSRGFSALFFGDLESGGWVRSLNKATTVSSSKWTLRDAGYASWLREILDPSSSARTSEDRVWIFVLSPRVFDDDGFESQLESFLTKISEAVGTRTVFFSTLFADPHGVLPLSQGPARSLRAEQANSRLQAFSSQHAWFHLLDVAAYVRRFGFEQLYDARFEAMARYMFHPGALDGLATWILRHLSALDQSPVKVIAVDFDNTLWGGILGEDGPEGIRVATSGTGLHFRKFQAQLKSLKNQGFLLVALSKNNSSEAEAVFSSHPEMLLRWDDFAAHGVNWRPKFENLSRIAGELSLGRDAFLFIDDSAHERGEMHDRLPEVKIFDFPTDPSGLCRALSDCSALDLLRATREDRLRAKSYEDNRERQKIQAQASSLDDYYRSLQTRVEIQKASPENEARLHQLMLKTNQFNLHSERPDPSAFRRKLSDSKREIWGFRISDRVGDAGLTGMIEISFEKATSWTVQNFLLSCRVLGRSVEYAVLHWLAGRATQAGIDEIRFCFVGNSRNQPALDFLQKAGLVVAGHEAVLKISGPDWKQSMLSHYATVIETGASDRKST
jgi:FkbH-like protein